MAETDLPTVMARIRTVLEAAPLSLVATAEGFSHDRQPTTLIDQTYYLEDAGLVSSRPMGNYKAARIDGIRVYVALRVNDDPHVRKETLESTLLDIERAIKTDGNAQSYHAEITTGRKVTQKRGSNVFVGSLGLTVDYDVAEN